jgi:serine/threonine protein kinase
VQSGVRAKVYEFDSPLFGDTGPLGTPRYAAPEQLQDPGFGARAAADVYALGAILHEALTGQDPFPAPSAMQALHRKLEGPPPASEHVPAALQDLLAAMLDPEPRRRPTAAAVGAALEAAIAA